MRVLLGVSILLPALALADEPAGLREAEAALRDAHEPGRSRERTELTPPAPEALGALEAVAGDPAQPAWTRAAALALLGLGDATGRADELDRAFTQLWASQRHWHAPSFRHYQNALELALGPAPGAGPSGPLGTARPVNPLGTAVPTLTLGPGDLPWLAARALVERDGLAALALGYVDDPRAIPVLLCTGLNRANIGGPTVDPARVALGRLAPSFGDAIAAGLDAGPNGFRAAVALVGADDERGRQPLAAVLEAAAAGPADDDGNQGSLRRHDVWAALKAIQAHPHPDYLPALRALRETRAEDERGAWDALLEACAPE